ALEDQKDSTLSRKTLVGILLAVFTFPTAFFFLGFYTESLFLFLVLLTFSLSKKQRWLLAGIVAGVASGTRIVVICLFPALILQAYLQHKKSGVVEFPWKAWAFSLLSFGGLVAYMIYLNHTYHDPLYFLHVQRAFGGGRQENLVIFPQVLYRYIKIIFTVSPTTWAYYALRQECCCTLQQLKASYSTDRSYSSLGLPILFHRSQEHFRVCHVTCLSCFQFTFYWQRCTQNILGQRRCCFWCMVYF